MKKGRFLILASLAFLWVGNAYGVSFDLLGVNNDYNTAHVELMYRYDLTQDLGQLDIRITNTALYDPIITGFAFNAPSEITDLLCFTGPEAMEVILDFDSIETPEQYGLFDVGVISGYNIVMGDIRYGVPVGETYNFSLLFYGTKLDTLTAESFLSELSFVSNVGEIPIAFLACFQQTGRGGDGYDVAFDDVAIPMQPVPEPATMLLFGTGMLGIAGTFRKKDVRRKM